MKALTVWRAVPPCCHAVLAQSMRAQHASNTTARANYHTHPPSFKRPAITFGRTSGWRRRRWNQSSEGRVGRVFKLGERSPLMCPPWATTPSAAINQAWQHAKRRWQHAIGDHEITPSSSKLVAQEVRNICMQSVRVFSLCLLSKNDVSERFWVCLSGFKDQAVGVMQVRCTRGAKTT